MNHLHLSDYDDCTNDKLFIRFGGTLVSHGNNHQWHNKVIFVGGVIWDQGLEMKIEFDELVCQNGICTWTELTVGLGTPRIYPIAMVVPKLMDCQTEDGTTPTVAPAVCENPTWIGDGYCDDITNNPECSYDGGDCCGPAVDTQFCSECQCIDGNLTTTTETATTTIGRLLKNKLYLFKKLYKRPL